MYYQSANPWLQVKLLKALQMWGLPTDAAMLTVIEECMSRIISKIDVGKSSSNRTNAEFSVFF